MSDQLPPPPPAAPPAPPAAEEHRKLGRPKGSKDKTKRAVPPSERVLKHRTRPETTPPPKTSRPEWERSRVDALLSAKDWAKVYEAYAETGDPPTISNKTGLDTRQVRHLLDFGIMRLGLKPIREHATDYAEVNQRVEALIGKQQQQERALTKRNESLPAVRAAVTDRAVRETAAAQGVLLGAVKAGDVLLNYVKELTRRLETGESELLIPDEVTVNHLETLSKVANNLSNAVSKAIEQSRLTAGEPTQNVALQVAAFVADLNRDELINYVATRQLPSHVRIRGGTRDQPQSTRVIDIGPEKPNG